MRFLVRWFQTKTLTPFAIYCLAFGALSIIRFLSDSQDQHPASPVTCRRERPDISMAESYLRDR